MRPMADLLLTPRSPMTGQNAHAFGSYHWHGVRVKNGLQRTRDHVVTLSRPGEILFRVIDDVSAPIVGQVTFFLYCKQP